MDTAEDLSQDLSDTFSSGGDSRDSRSSRGGSSSRSDTGSSSRDRDRFSDSGDSGSSGGGIGDTIGGWIDEGADRARDFAEDVDESTTVDEQIGSAVDKGVDTAKDVASDPGGAAHDVVAGVDEATRVDEQIARGIDEAGRQGQQALEDMGRAADAEVQKRAGQAEAAMDAVAGSPVGEAGAATQDFLQAGTAIVQGDPERAQAEMASAGENAGEVVQPVGKYVDDLTRRSAEQPTPHVGMVANEEGYKARGEREKTFAERAEQGWEDIQTIEVQHRDYDGDGQVDSGERIATTGVSSAEAGAMWFQGAEMAERSLMDLGHGISKGSPIRGMGPELLGEPIGNAPGNVIGFLPATAGAGLGAIAQWPVTAAADITEPSVGQEPGSETPSQQSGGAVDMFVRGGERQIDYAVEHPATSLLALGLVGAEAGPAFARGYRSPRGSYEVPYRTITDEYGARGEISRFETRPGESTAKAVEEVRTRASDQPSEVTEATGQESLLYHTTGEKLPSDLTVTEGASELPGLWTAPDANPVGLRGTSFGETLSGYRPRLPNWRTTPDRVAAFEGSRIEGMPGRAQGAAYEVRGPSGEIIARGLGRGEAKSRAADIEGAEVAPDTTTGGYEFLTGEAEPGTAYVRPTGSRSSELEAIFRPESEFGEVAAARGSVRVGGREVNVPYTDWQFTVGGERLPVDFFRRVGESAESVRQGAEAARQTVEGGGAEPTTYREITGSYGYNPTTGTAITSYPAAGLGANEMTGAIDQDLADLYGEGRITGEGSRQTSTGDGAGSDTYTDPTSTGGDPDLPHDWRRGTDKEIQDRQKEIDDPYHGETSGGSESTGGHDGGYVDDYGGGYDDYVDDITYIDETVADTGSRITGSDPRVTSGSPTGGGTSTGGGSTTGGGSSGGPTSGGSPTGGGPSSDPPYYDPPRYDPPRYPTTPPSSPVTTESIPEESEPFRPYEPPYIPDIIGRPYYDEDDEVADQQLLMSLEYGGQSWVNPVADAQEAIAAIGGGGGFDPLGAVREDLENLG